MQHRVLFPCHYPLIPMLGTVSCSEKELGSIVNLYVTRVTRSEFLIGKQIPYVVLATQVWPLLRGAKVVLNLKGCRN